VILLAACAACLWCAIVEDEPYPIERTWRGHNAVIGGEVCYVRFVQNHPPAYPAPSTCHPPPPGCEEGGGWRSIWYLEQPENGDFAHALWVPKLGDDTCCAPPEVASQ